MSMVGPANVEERIDRTTDPWLDWGGMLRNHPVCLQEIMDRVEPSKNMLDAIYRTRALAKWMQVNAAQLCQVVCVERPEQKNYEIGVHFGSSPYGPAMPVPGIGTCYVDPFFRETPLTWDMVDSGMIEVNGQQAQVDVERLLRNPLENALDQLWQRKIRGAEREWFSRSPLAPVAVVTWEKKSYGLTETAGEPCSWDATTQILGVEPEMRRQITGWRGGSEAIPEFLDCVDENIRNQRESYNLELRIHKASPGLIAARQAKLIDSNTQVAAGEERSEQWKRRL